MSDLSTKISANELIELIDADRTPVIYDVRKLPAFQESGQLLPGAIWKNFETIARDINISTGTPIVVYCVHGHEVSQGAAAQLRGAGHNARYLEGGFEDYAGAGGVTNPNDNGEEMS